MIPSMFPLDRNEFWECGVQTLSLALAAGYLLLTAAALLFFMFLHSNYLSGWKLKLIQLIFAFMISCGPPAYYWLLSREFDNWVHHKFTSDKVRFDREVDAFKVQAEGGRAFWAGVLAVCGAVLLKFGEGDKPDGTTSSTSPPTTA